MTYNALKSFGWSVVDDTPSRALRTSQASRRPVVIIPGLGGSMVFNKWSKNMPDIPFLERPMPACYASESTWQPLWVNPVAAMSQAAGANCWKYRMTPHYDQGYSNQDGVDADPWQGAKLVNSDGTVNLSRYFGGIDGVNILLQVEDWKIPVKMGYMFQLLLADLQKIGYEAQKDLFGAPYDFRVISSTGPSEQYYEGLMALLTHAAMGGSPPAVVTHSLGCVVFKRFLSEYLPKKLGGQLTQWKQKNLGSWICVGGPFGGAPMALRTALSGDDEGLGAMCVLEGRSDNCRLWYQKMEKLLSGIAWMLPSAPTYTGLQVVKHGAADFVKVSATNAALQQLLQDAEAPEAADALGREILPINATLLTAPSVNCHFIVGVADPTELQYVYKEGPFADPVINKESYAFYQKWMTSPDVQTVQKEIFAQASPTGSVFGDRTVPWLALHLPLIWLNQTSVGPGESYGKVKGSNANGSYTTTFKEFVGSGDKYDHKLMLNTPEVRNYILSKIAEN